MTKKYASLFLIGLLGAIPAAILGQDARTVLTNSSKAMGADNLKTLRFAAMGSRATNIGQGTNPKMAWPVTRVKSYLYEADFSATRSQIRLDEATLGEYVSADSPWDSQFRFWLSPVAFLKAAMANNSTVRSETIDGMRYNVVTLSLQNKYKLVGYINEQNLIERVQTWIDNPVLGDMLTEASYSGYKDFGGLKFPTLIVEKQGGFPVLILSVSDVTANAEIAFRIATPPPPAPLTFQTEKIADGVFDIKESGYHSVAVEFADHVAVIEAPLGEARSIAVLGATKRLIPNKPIRYVINTHHHFDHSGGLRTYVDEGATIITHESNKEFFQKTLSSPHTLNPDRLAVSQKKPTMDTVGDKKVLSDATRTLEIHLIKDNPHSDGLLMAYLPKEKILIEADAYTPPNPTTINRATLNLVDNVEKLKLDFDRILPLTGEAVISRAELYAAIGKPVPSITEILARVDAPPAGQRGQRGQAAAAPGDDRGKQILESVCTMCHNLNRVQTKNLAQSDWQIIVDRMKGRGAELSDDETSALLTYLTKSYGPK